ncbi:reticulon-4-interacting protein 1, mitochondrial [Orussus abietinus]|uniref:reticulon-4-interacting protein 1, mitochondrial n=1 Tax=Orussus abietinus TaxID=222816 RepID=UPI0006267C0A|nr:reticulon-4-interacting protein 1, mitochondrial [Orussus abietinus]
MDDVWFRLSCYFDNLQFECRHIIDKVQTSAATQQVHRWILLWSEQCCQLLRELYDGLQRVQIKESLLGALYWLQRIWEQLQFQYYSLEFNPKDFYRQLTNLLTKEVQRRELFYFLVGSSIGGLIGYSIGSHWPQKPLRVHHMKAVICHHYIGIEGVAMIEDEEIPTIVRSDELLIQVKATSVNVIDVKICQGYSKAYRRLLNSGRHKDLPVILGRDCAGIVVDIGRGVVNFDVGDEVFLAVPSWAPGTMSEYLVVPEAHVAKRPKLATFESSASLAYNGCLAWDALVKKSVIEEGNAKGKRVLVYGGNTPIGCILIQLVKLWGGHVVSACKPHAIPVIRALGADEVIPLNDVNIEKELELYDKFNAIFYTGGDLYTQCTLKKHLLPYGSYVSTVPENLTSDSLGFIFGSIFSGYVRIKLLLQYLFGCNTRQWKEGAKISPAYLQALTELVEADQLQTVVDRAYTPQNIERALQHVLDPSAIGSTVIKFQ